MITHAEIEKLLAVHCARPEVLSLYLRVPADPPALRGLPDRAENLIAQAAQAARSEPPEAGDARARDDARHIARRTLEVHARQWLGHSVAIFASGEPGLAESIMLPCLVEDRAVLATRPHVRPLLLALQRSPGYYLAIADGQRAWVFRVTDGRTDRMTVPAGITSPGFGGWYSLEEHRAHEPVTQLAAHPCGDMAGVLGRIMHGRGPERLVIGGSPEGIRQFLAALADDARDRFIGSFAADPAAMTLTRIEEQAGEISRRRAETSERRLAERVRHQADGLAAVGLEACLKAVNEGAIGVLIVPPGGLIPGYACQRCGQLSSTGTDCPDWGAAAMAVPDLLEEMAVRVLHDGGLVETVDDPPGRVAALLQFQLPAAEGPTGAGRGATAQFAVAAWG